jgi:hypothetical protein
MAAMTTAVIAGAGTLMSFYGSQQQAKAAKAAGKLNAQDAEENARLAVERAAEDERQFRLSFRRDQASNVAAIASSGVKLEGSPLEVLQDNAASAERDALNIRRGGEIQRDSYLRQARQYRKGSAASANAAQISGAAELLKGAGNTYETGRKSGAWS